MAASVFTVLYAAPAFGSIVDAAHADRYATVTDSTPGGLVYEGQPVDNIYLYDSDGQRLTNVRAFDQTGRPIDLSTWRLGSDGNPLAPLPDQYGTQWFNVLPIPQTPSTDPWSTVTGTGAPWNAPKVLPPMVSTSPATTPLPTPTDTDAGIPKPSRTTPTATTTSQ